jgi:hypothetical protein
MPDANGVAGQGPAGKCPVAVACRSVASPASRPPGSQLRGAGPSMRITRPVSLARRGARGGRWPSRQEFSFCQAQAARMIFRLPWVQPSRVTPPGNACRESAARGGEKCFCPYFDGRQNVIYIKTGRSSRPAFPAAYEYDITSHKSAAVSRAEFQFGPGGAAKSPGFLPCGHASRANGRSP